MPPNEKPRQRTGGAEVFDASTHDSDTTGRRQAPRAGIAQRLNVASPPLQYEMALPPRSADDVRLERLDRVGPFYRKIEAADASRAKSVFKAAQHALELGDAAEAGRLLAEWRRLTGGKDGDS